MHEAFDLTTSAGLKTALIQARNAWAWVMFPRLKLVSALVDWVSSASDIAPEKQAEAAERVIRAGREHGAKRVKIKINKSVGAKVSGDAEGATINAHVGSDGTMELEVEYK